MRELMGMTQREVADRLGVSRQRVQQIEADSPEQETSTGESDPLETAKIKAIASTTRPAAAVAAGAGRRWWRCWRPSSRSCWRNPYSTPSGIGTLCSSSIRSPIAARGTMS